MHYLLFDVQIQNLRSLFDCLSISFSQLWRASSHAVTLIHSFVVVYHSRFTSSPFDRNEWANPSSSSSPLLMCAYIYALQKPSVHQPRHIQIENWSVFLFTLSNFLRAFQNNRFVLIGYNYIGTVELNDKFHFFLLLFLSVALFSNELRRKKVIIIQLKERRTGEEKERTIKRQKRRQRSKQRERGRSHRHLRQQKRERRRKSTRKICACLQQ